MNDMQEEFEKTKESMIGRSVRFPENPSDPDRIGTVTDVYYQPAIDLDNDTNKGIRFLSPDEVPDKHGNRPTTKLRPKILCIVLFDGPDGPGYVHITQPQDLVLIDIGE